MNYYSIDQDSFVKIMITIFKLRITTEIEIKDQQRMKFFWIRTSQIIMNNKLLERRRFMENKIIKNFIFKRFYFLPLIF